MDPEEGWQKVLPRVGGERLLSRAELEKHERQILKEWETSRGHWSGIGKHTPAHDFAEAKKLHNHRFKPQSDKPLGSGSFGIVEKVHYVHSNRTICLARKHIRYQRRRTIQLMREEANVMEKLDHDHIVKLVGTYCVKPNELFILLWPVAVCNLDELFNDLDALKNGHGDQDIFARLEALELRDTSAVEQNRQGMPVGNQTTSPLHYLQQLIGCIARAVAYCHEANIRHLDLKPSNILLSPGRVYLADFGIARDVHDRDCTMTIGPQGTPKWRAPEILNQDDEWSMKAADVYSLGLILLNIATVLYGADMADFDAVIGELSPRRREEKLEAFHVKLEAMALATQTLADPNAPTFAPRHILNLTSRMLSSEPARRPIATHVDTELVELGGLDQIYHSPCCKRSARYVLDRMNSRLKFVADDRNRLQTENQTLARRVQELKASRETWEARHQNELKIGAERTSHLQSQLEKERTERKKAESLVEELKRAGPTRRHVPNRQSISRPGPPERERPIPTGPRNPTNNGLTMRTQSTHPLPTSATPVPTLQPQTQRKSSTHIVSTTLQPTYLSQTAASASRVAVSPAPGPMRRVSMPRPSPGSPGPSFLPASNSPTPESPGYTLRSRNSGSRLPQPVNPVTPIRSGTPQSGIPNLSRDPSSTDSTQLSMSSSTFSRLSGHSRYSAADTSVAGTPALESSPLPNAGRQGRPDDNPPHVNVPSSPNGPNNTSPEATIGLGLGLEKAVRRESIVSDRPSFHGDTASVATSAAGPTSTTSIASPVLSSSTLSSPRATYVVMDPQTGHIRLPPLPTARSWAEVAVARPVRIG